MQNEYVSLVEEAGKSLGLLGVWAMEGQEGEPAQRITLRYDKDMKLDLPKIEIHQLLSHHSKRPKLEVMTEDIKRRLDAGEAVYIGEE